MPDPTEVLCRDPQNAGLFLDFDGTLSDVVTLPHEARPRAGVPQLLRDLSERFKTVAVVSGRAARELVEWLGDGIEIWGVHGAERVVDSQVQSHETMRPHLELMRRVLEEAEIRMSGMEVPGALIEDKGVIINLHFRAAEDPERAASRLHHLAHDLAGEHGLRVARGRMSYELRAPVDLSKAAVVLERSRAEDLHAVAFVGDDRVDLPGFDALDQLSDEGIDGVRVAVDSREAPEDLIARADVVVDGPEGAVLWLEDLLVCTDRVG